MKYLVVHIEDIDTTTGKQVRTYSYEFDQFNRAKEYYESMCASSQVIKCYFTQILTHN